MSREKVAVVMGALTNLAIRWGIHQIAPTNDELFENVATVMASTAATTVSRTISALAPHSADSVHQEIPEIALTAPTYYQIHPIQIDETVHGYLALIPNTDSYPNTVKQVYPEWFPSPQIAIEWIKNDKDPASIVIEVINPTAKHPLTMTAQTAWLAYHQQKPVEAWDLPKGPWMIAPISETQQGTLLGYAAWHYRLSSRGTEVAVLTADRRWSTADPPRIFPTQEDALQEIATLPFKNIPMLEQPLVICPHQLSQQLTITLSPEQRNWVITRRAPSSFVPVPCDPILQQNDSVVPTPRSVDVPDTHPQWYLAPVDPQKPEGLTCAWHFDHAFPQTYIEIAGVMNASDQWKLVTWHSYEAASWWMRGIGEWTQPHPQDIPNPKIIRSVAFQATVVPKTPTQQFPAF